ncbi:hypothetical protein EKO27_g6774 [Xylaria grammica]|uniref:Uncharacterized protein n=1 Tax=Xylaria grammica TaxID=363999 RepID=A0A439D1J3_9PEZI|nr:hypothetical protein EKO27_g6774 [Xylaria grammica]
MRVELPASLFQQTARETSSRSPAPVAPLQDSIANLKKDRSLRLSTVGKLPSSKRKQLHSDRDSSHHTSDRGTPVATPINNSKRRRPIEEANHQASKAVTPAPDPAMTSEPNCVESEGEGKLGLTEEDLISYTRYVVAHSRHHDFLPVSDAAEQRTSLREAMRHTEPTKLPRTTYTHLATVLHVGADWAFVEVHVSSHTISVWPISSSSHSDLSRNALAYLQPYLDGVSRPHKGNAGPTSDGRIAEDAPGAA